MVLREPIWCYAKPGTETAYGRTEKSIYFYGYTFIVKGWTVAPYSILLRACAVLSEAVSGICYVLCCTERGY